MTKQHDEEKDDLLFYGDPRIATGHGKVPGWLMFSYFFWIAVGLFVLVYFWNGSRGWFDRGYWQQLQRAANTTLPTQNQDDPSLNKDN